MSTRKIIFGATAAVAATIAGVGVAAAIAADDDAGEESGDPFTFEVVEDGNRFAFDEAPVFDDGMPDYGNPFVTQGFIYEEGTLADGGGVNADGTPTHPDAVIGTWLCEGVMIGEGARTETGPWVVSNQVYDFEDFDGADAVITSGLEASDVGVAIERDVIGGTGEHAGADGAQTQVLEAFNESGGVNLTVTLDPEG